MNRHQVLTGAANSLEQSVSIGSIENNHFTAYGSGVNIVILASNFDRVQIISGHKYSESILHCLDCTLGTGKIAAAYGNHIHIFEPTPSANKASHSFNFKWVHVGSLELDSCISCISWNGESNRVLVGCQSGTVQIWSYNPHSFETTTTTSTKKSPAGPTTTNLPVQFSIYNEESTTGHQTSATSGERETSFHEAENNEDNGDGANLFSSTNIFKKLWEKKLANPVKFLKYSPDGTLFASFGQNDRFVKIWHEVKSVSQILTDSRETSRESSPIQATASTTSGVGGGAYQQGPIEYDYVYLAHPRAVTSVSWRQISKFMPKGMVSNSILTSCLDNICRIWTETIVPDDGLLHTQSEESTYTSITKSAGHKHKLLNKLHKMRAHSHIHLPILRSFSLHDLSYATNLYHRGSKDNTTGGSGIGTAATLHPASQLSFADSHVNSNLSANVRHNASNTNSLANTPDGSSGLKQPPGIHASASSVELIHQTKHGHHQTPVGTALQGGFHFHLAGFIDPEAGIPFHLPNIKSSARDANFIVHWCNNKDFYFTYLAEAFSKEIYTRLQQYHGDKLRQQQQAKSKQTSMDNLDKQPPDSHSNSSGNHQQQSNNNMDYFDFMLGLNLDDEAKSLLFGNSIEQKLDAMVKDWYTSHDILFCIHPFDGSVLIWLVDWLDEYMPGSYRQAQVSFHAKLPNSVPVGDAISLTSSVSLYIEPVKLSMSSNNNDTVAVDEDETIVKSTSQQVDVFMPGVVHLVSKHSNGTLNLWKLQFQENSKYQSLVYMSHLSRVCGHRFLVNSVHSHPILPFLLTNSVNELTSRSVTDLREEKQEEVERSQQDENDNDCGLLETFQRGIIIWGVEPVGPLCVTGGIYELARIDSSKPNSFENIAWFPSFLPSSTLGNLSSSPSTLFASTDAERITIYQAVFDARTLLHDLQRQQNKHATSAHHHHHGQQQPAYNKLISTVSATGSTTTDIPFDNFNIVSIQSTARPGCIIELDHLADSAHSQGSWVKADLFHVYQEGLIRSTGRRSGHTTTKQSMGGGSGRRNLPYQPYSSASAIVSESQHVFNETFFVVLLEKSRRHNRVVEQVHMWQATIKSSLFVSDSGGIEDNESSISANTTTSNKNRLTISSQRVCNQELPLPQGVHVVSAETAAADLAASAMFSINRVPYLFATGCSDGVVRFWSCSQLEDNTSNENNNEQQVQFEFSEWKMSDLSGSHVKFDAIPLSISCSYNSRFAVAFRKTAADHSKSSSSSNSKTTFADYCVNIYECESTGGSEWRLEDSICLNSIVLPELDSGINLDYIFGDEKPLKPTRSMHSFKNMIFGGGSSSNYSGTTSPPHNVPTSPSAAHFSPFNFNVDVIKNSTSSSSSIPVEIPSTAAKISIKRQITTLNTIKPENSRFKKKAINLDWGSTENGSHILTIGLGNRIFIYSCVMRAKAKTSTSGSISNNDGLIEWKQFRTFELDSADDQQALPSHVKWVREGLLVIGLDTEMHVYSQWSMSDYSDLKHSNQVEEEAAAAVLAAKNSSSQVNSRKPSVSIMTRKNPSVLDLNKLSKLSKEKKPTTTSNRLGDDLVSETRRESMMDEYQERSNSLASSNKQFMTASSVLPAPVKKFDHAELLEVMQDSGLFMQAKYAWPVLPQYHPRQLLELMNYGKINRVKAILMHLTRCIIDFELKNNSKVNTQKKLKRKMSVSSESGMPEEQVLNYLEIDTIPPLPLFALFASDSDDFSMKDEKNESNKAAAAQSVGNNKNSYDLLTRGGAETDELKLNSTGFDDDFEFDEERKAKLLEKRAAKEKLEFKKALLASNQTLQNFDSTVCKLLIEYLTCVHLNGLSSIDQMYLVALADTVANVRCDNINSDVFAKKDTTNSSSSSTTTTSTTNQIVDNCGLKFLLALRSYNYLIRTLPAPNRAELRQVGLGTANFAWAYHSECEQELLAALAPQSTSNENETSSVLTWSDLRQYGVGWWLKNPTLLKQLIEKVAKSAFQQKSDPLDAALFYLAMKKKGVLWGLFKTVKDTKMSEFFKNDFAEAKWQTAALKNAFVLLGKQRFEHAAAFFLLAGRLKDAVEVCIRSLHDLQLGLVIVRLYETDYDKLSHYIKSILFAEVLGYDLLPSVDPVSGVKKSDSFGQLSAQPKKENISPDAFLRSMSYWYVKDYKSALNTLYDVEKGDLTTYSTSESSSTTTNISQVFNFYTFLKNHPLLIRQQLVNDNENAKSSASSSSSKKTLLMPVERRLHFIAGYYHLVNGCPLLSLDILSKLPKHLTSDSVVVNHNENESNNIQQEEKNKALDFVDNVPKKVEKATDFDWSTPTFNNRFDDDELDLNMDDSDDEDEEEVVKVEEEKEKASRVGNLTDDDKINKPGENRTTGEMNDDDDDGAAVDTFAQQIKFISCLKILIEEMSTLSTGFEVVGGQLRYYMYYWLERETQLIRELGDYGNAYEANLPLYCDDEEAVGFNDNQFDPSNSDATLIASGEQLTPGSSYVLHEQLLLDQKSFQSKVNRLNKRKEWLRSNELLLRTFLCYCSLHSANGAGLTSVKMELVLLMQELVEDRGMKQLLFSPIPLPTTIPLLAASIASSKNIVAGPIKMIKSLSTDVLASLVKINKVPVIFDYSLLITTVKEAAVSLSSCIYQCLCDSDSFTVNDNSVKTGMEGFSRNILYKSSHLMSGMKKADVLRQGKQGEQQQQERIISSAPKTWPGIANLNKLLERDQDNEAPKLKILLFESLVAVYSSLLVNAFVFYDCSTLWRLLTKPWSEQMWNRLFGGGCQIEHKYRTSTSQMPDDENAKQRLKINARLGHVPSFAASSSSPPKSVFMTGNRNNSSSVVGDERVYVREMFVAPEISMINYFMSKPENHEMNNSEDGYDSDEDHMEQSKRDVLDEDPEIIYGKRYYEHMNPKSYSWHLMRYAIIKYTIANITSFLPIIGVEFQEIAILSPLIHQIIKTLENWMELILIDLNALGGAPEDYIPNCSLGGGGGTGGAQQFTHFNGPKILKYQSMLDPANTPFVNEKFTYPARRLWHFLVTRKPLHDTFIRYIFKKNKTAGAVNSGGSGYTADPIKRNDIVSSGSDAFTSSGHHQSSFKIIHKDQEHIYGFCINERDKNMLALCTGKEIIEMDMRNLLTRNTPIDDECELDILNLQTPRPTYEQDVYVIGGLSLVTDSSTAYNTTIAGGGGGSADLQQKSLRSSSISNVRKPINYGNLLSNPEFVYKASERTRCLIPKILKRPVKEVRRLASHPTLPYYLSGTNESVVKLWHWGSTDPLSTFKQSDKSSAKITKVLFNTHGNKFGVSDLDGQVNLYQLLGCSFKSFLTIRCQQVINDFLFLDSSSIILTAGVSNDSYVVSVWDTLLPASKCQVKCFKEPDASSAICAAYSPLNHLVYCGSRKGEVYIYDIRMHRRLQKFTAHESAVKAIAVDMDECMLATGSNEGNVKTWNLRTLESQQTYHNEHARSSIIRSFNTGVNQLYFTSDNQLISCGADGTLVVRKFT